ncbi:kinesin-like protein KIF20A [Hoplias malabaricus]|uniref:kinesin-like protein KIF20A n=1 Tax=Hoplias malabaricus TaxID=27720 RepID=UPI003461FEF4
MMSVAVPSPGAVLSDEEECGAVFESTAADIGGLAAPRRFGAPLQEISVISPPLDPQTPAKEVVQKSFVERRGSRDEAVEKLKVFLRVRPLTETEKDRGEEQGCVYKQNEETLLLSAPKDSQNMKNAERGIVQSSHKFNFTQIFGPETSQQEVYDQTMREMVRDVLRGENRLLYTYGITNSGKTYTVQGTTAEAGLLPRALVSVFHKIGERLYPSVDLKPILCQEVRRLDASEVQAEEAKRDALLKEEETSKLRGASSIISDSGIGGLSALTRLEDSDAVCLDVDPLSLSSGDGLEQGLQYSIWVSFYEIYNEFLYDLLDTLPSLQSRKRATLRLSDDKYGNPYVKDLTWVQVRSAQEAWRVLRVGRRNQSFASTHLNHNSSRSHSIFTIRLLHIDPQVELKKGTRISELSVCDLAGSERCKDQQNGDRMKEANNINTSLLTLGRCISALRHNQNNKSRAPQVVPFRDSKLTRVLQSFFCGHGRSCMVVNINPCTSTYDETLQALKFSAIATQLVHGPSTKTRVAYILSLLREQNTLSGNSILNEEDEEESDEEGDLTMFDQEELLKAVEVLKSEVLRQRQEKEDLEAQVREQVCSEMMEIINRMQDDFSETLENERELMEERYENKINNLKGSLRKYYSAELKERDDQIRELSEALTENEKEASSAPTFPTRISDNLRRSKRLASFTQGHNAGHANAELEQCKAELEQCKTELEQSKAELDLKQTELRLKTLELKRFQDQVPFTNGSTLTNTAERKLLEGQKNLRQLRSDLHVLGAKLQSGERACCRNTDGEKLRTALSAADFTLGKQVQMLVELQTSLQLVKAELRHKDESLFQLQLQRPPAAPTPSSCKRRGCGENQPPPQKRQLLRSLFTPSRTPSKTITPSKTTTITATTPYASVLRSRQPSPPPSPAFTRRGRF